MIRNDITWKDQFVTALDNGDWSQVERLVDGGLRHIPNMDIHDALKQWLRVGRMFGFATHDGSWAEFEKEFAIIITRLARAEAVCKVLVEIDNNGGTNYRAAIELAREALGE